MRDIEIISITYSLELTPEVYTKCWKADVRKEKTLCDVLEEVPEIDSIDYLMHEGPYKIRIKLLTSSVKEVDPKYNHKLWQRIASIINDHIKEE